MSTDNYHDNTTQSQQDQSNQTGGMSSISFDVEMNDLEMNDFLVEMNGLENAPKSTPMEDHNVIHRLEAIESILQQQLLNRSKIGPKSQKLIAMNQTQDDQALIAKIIRIALVTLITASIFGYEYIFRYSDPNYNTLTQSTVNQIEYLDIPFVYINAALATSFNISKNVSVQGISTNDSYGINVVEYSDEYDFTYNESIKQWTLLRWTDVKKEQAFLIPPYGATVQVGGYISIYIACNYKPEHSIPNPNSLKTEDTISNPHVPPSTTDSNSVGSENILDLFSNARLYGLFWDVGAPSELEQNGINETKEYYQLLKEQFTFTFIGTRNMYYIDLFEEINSIYNTEKQWYSASYVASVLDKSQKKGSVIETLLRLYPNPTGGGRKTTVTITQRMELMDVFSLVGGIFGPLNTMTLLILAWCIFGIHSSRFRLFGFAPFHSMSYAKRLQVKMYLINLGIISDDQICIEQCKKTKSKIGHVLDNYQHFETKETNVSPV